MTDQQDNLNNQNDALSAMKAESKDQSEIIAALEDENHRLNYILSKISQSASWKMTAPFRFAGAFLRKTLTRISEVVMKKSNHKPEIKTIPGIGEVFLKDSETASIQNTNTGTEKVPGKFSEVKIQNHFDQIEFRSSTNPLVSIIIPVFNQWKLTYNCLQSIQKNTSEIEYEIIVADDSSSDETLDITTHVKNFILVRNNKNLGFLLTCNKAAKYATGKYLVLLNNDTIVHEKWLTSLVSVAETDEKAGMVGPKFVYPDGKLLEAGGIIWSNATGLNYGRGDNPDKPEYNYLKEVDYISGAGLLIRKKLWDDLNGFDEQFSPAYFKDTDMAYSCRQLGYKVICQPLSVITHHECGTYSQNPAARTSDLLELNRKKFLRKWKSVLEQDKSSDDFDVFLHRDRFASKRKVLIIDKNIPFSNEDEIQNGILSYVEHFMKMGLDVKFAGEDFFEHQPETQHLQQMGIEVFYGDDSMLNFTQWLTKHLQYFDFVVFNQLFLLRKYARIVSKFKKIRIVWAAFDLLKELPGTFTSMGEEKLKNSGNKSRVTNMTGAGFADVVLVFSDKSKEIVKSFSEGKKVILLPVNIRSRKQFVGEQESEFKVTQNWEMKEFKSEKPDIALKETFPLGKKKILIIGTESFPYPPSFNGVTENVYHILKYLNRCDEFTADFLYLQWFDQVEEDRIEELKKIANKVFIINKRIKRRYSSVFEYYKNDEYQKLLARYDLLFFSSFTSMFNIPVGKKAKSILYIADSMSHYTKNTRSDRTKSKYLTYLLEELIFFKFYKTVIVVSENDKNHLDRFCKPKKVVQVPIGIDIDKINRQPKSKTFDVVFSGNLDYPPNREAAEFLAGKIAPRLIEAKPDIKIVLVGRNPGSLKKFGSDNIIITGEVKDVMDYIEMAGVYVSPVFSGSGMKNKILQAIGAGIPIVGTSGSFGGFRQLPNETVIKIDPSYEQQPKGWVNPIMFLLEKDYDRKQLKQENLEFLKRTYSWEQIIKEYYIDLIGK